MPETITVKIGEGPEIIIDLKETKVKCDECGTPLRVIHISKGLHFVRESK